MKRSLLRKAVIGFVGLALVACTEMPAISSFNTANQQKLSSASHWEIIAKQVSEDVYTTIGYGQSDCIRFDRDVQSESKFQTFLTAAVTHQLMPSAPYTGRVHIYSSDPPDSKCNVIALRTAVIEHKGPVARPYPGKYTLLAAGLVGIRHIVRAFSEAKFVGLTAAAEAAFWASAGFRSSDTVTELTITTSYVDPNGIFIAEDANVYYIDSSDSALYQPRELKVKNSKPESDDSVSHPQRPAIAAGSTKGEPDGSKWQPKRRRLEVHPETISVCDTTAEFLVSGEYLAIQYSDFMFGTISASGFGTGVPLNTNARQTAQVKFAALNKANIGLDEVALSMISVDGVPATAKIAVSGDPKTCPAAKASTSGISNVVLTPVSTDSDAVEVCREKWSLAVSGANAADVKGAKILEGNHVAKVTPAGDDKSVILQFDPLTEYRTKPLPSGDSISIQLTDASKATVAKNISVTCQGQQIKATPTGAGQKGAPQQQPPKRTASPQATPEQGAPEKAAAQQAAPPSSAPPGKNTPVASISSAHWTTTESSFPPNHVSFQAYGMSVPLVLVYGNHTKVPMPVSPYYISTEYLPVGIVTEYSKSHSIIGEVSTSEDGKAVCRIFRSDLQAIARALGFEIPPLNDWINAFEAGVIVPKEKRELALLPGGVDGKHDLMADIGVVRSGESANVRFSSKLSFFVFPEAGEGAEEPKGCVRIMISQAKLKQLLRTQNPK